MNDLQKIISTSMSPLGSWASWLFPSRKYASEIYATSGSEVFFRNEKGRESREDGGHGLGRLREGVNRD